MEFSFSNKRWLTPDEIKKDTNIDRNGLGFHKPGMWDKVVDINKCHLQSDPSNEIRNAIRSYSIQKKFEFFEVGSKFSVLEIHKVLNLSDKDFS